MKLSEVLKKYENVSLKRACEELHVCYQYVLKASKKPIEGEKYDASAFNEEAVEKIISKSEVKIDSIDWEVINASNKKISVNKPEEFEINVNFKLRSSNEVIYRVIFTTETHVVFIATDDTQPRVMNWDTFVHQSPRIAK